jgi:2-polyprenyl-3-methyl-5-hydroxy-6-metoxy-1,4-benzoquinol methylase
MMDTQTGRNMVAEANLNRSQSVRAVFENAPRYLKSRRVDMELRSEAVRTWAANLERRRMMDIGCGDGSISLPLLTPSTKMTLLDLSANMLERARANVPAEMTRNVELREGDFQTAEFDPASFDLIITVGVMAHVASPSAFLGKVRDLLRPNGWLIVEFTDAFHGVGRIDRFFGWMKERIAPRKYSTNLIAARDVTRWLSKQGFTMVSEYRYSRLPLPGIHRVVPASLLVRLVRMIFGSARKNRNAWLGNEHICLLRAEG